MFTLFRKRNKVTLVDTTGYVDLPTACVRANQTGYFGLSQRVAPESFDGKNTNIDPRECFFGGRRVELALQAQKAADFATKSPGAAETKSPGNESGIDTNEQM